MRPTLNRLASRVAGRWIVGSALWTVPYLQKLVEVAVSAPGGWGDGSPAARVLRALIRSAEAGNVDPFPVADLWAFLKDRDVPEDEVAALGVVSVPRTRARRGPGFGEVWRDFERDTGKSTILTDIDLEDPRSDRLVPSLKAVAKAVTNLPRHAARLWDAEVKKVRLRGSGRGSEDASWDRGGVLSINLDRSLTAPMWRSHIVHEMGHALEESKGLVVTAWDDTPYGKPPFVSDYAETNASEDFAETFRAYEMEASRLRRVAPAKYTDMAARVR